MSLGFFTVSFCNVLYIVLLCILSMGRSAGEGIGYPLQFSRASLVAQLVKNPLAMQETWVRDPLEKEMGPGLF